MEEQYRMDQLQEVEQMEVQSQRNEQQQTIEQLKLQLANMEESQKQGQAAIEIVNTMHDKGLITFNDDGQPNVIGNAHEVADDQQEQE